MNSNKHDELYNGFMAGWEELQDEIANDRNSSKNARGSIYPNNRAGRRAEAKAKQVDRKKRQKRGQWK